MSNAGRCLKSKEQANDSVTANALGVSDKESIGRVLGRSKGGNEQGENKR
jgi:hypothetical protein